MRKDGGGRAPDGRPGLNTSTATTPYPYREIAVILTESPAQVARRRVRARLADEHRRLGCARLAEQAMPMRVLYGPRPLRAVPLAQYLAEGWWAA